MELKRTITNVKMIITSSLNRTFMELKLDQPNKDSSDPLVLIEPLWN